MAGYRAYKPTLPYGDGSQFHQQPVYNRAPASQIRGRGGSYGYPSGLQVAGLTQHWGVIPGADSYGREEFSMMEDSTSYEDICFGARTGIPSQSGFPTRGRGIFPRGTLSRGSFQKSRNQIISEQAKADGNNSAEDGDDDSCKLFVGGLDWELTADQIHEYFEMFGPVVEVKLKTDIYTGQSRGFAFLKFQQSESVDKVMEQKVHMILGKRVDPKRAVTGEGSICGKKVFVGGMDPSMSEEFIFQAFSEYGKVVLVELPVDRHTNQRRSFGFVLFESEESVNQLCQKSKVRLGDKLVDIRKVQSKEELKPKQERVPVPAALAYRGKRRGAFGVYGVPTAFDGNEMYSASYDYYDPTSQAYYDPSFGFEVASAFPRGFRAGPNTGVKNTRPFHPYSR